jgi:hypothetical protein
MNDFLEILRRFQSEAPVNVVGLAQELGIKVWTSEKLASQISGKLFPDAQLGGSSGYAIVVNGTHAKTRQRFTIAHEIAHFVLHRKEIGAGVSDNEFYRSNLSNSMETEANRLAAEIIMPYSLIKKIKSQNSLADNDFATLAQALMVSEVAMKIRLGINF